MSVQFLNENPIIPKSQFDSKDGQYIDSLKRINIGSGQATMKTDENGLFLGADNFSDAPFNVDYAGLCKAVGLELTGGSIRYGKTAYTDDTNAGYWLGNVSGVAKLNIGASSTKYFHYDGTDLIILGGTITGSTIQTATTGRRMKFSNADSKIQWLNGDTEEGYIYNNGSGDMIIDADNTIQIQADGSGDDIVLYAGGDIGLDAGGTVWFAVDGDWQVNYADNVYINFTDATFSVREDGGDAFKIDASKDAWFADDVDISGTLSKGSGSFKIDHPLKPLTHYLYHSFVESPEMLNIYKGRGKIEHGIFIIDLPDYFEALNKDFEYNLTSIGQKANLWISKEVFNNKVEVSSDVDCDFSWVVYGVRQDPFALANPIIPEVEKIIQGYIHPELYGESQTLHDKIESENYRRKRDNLPLILNHNKKDFVKVKRQSSLDEDILVEIAKAEIARKDEIAKRKKTKLLIK
jgi:hypothetical protein